MHFKRFIQISCRYRSGKILKFVKRSDDSEFEPEYRDQKKQNYLSRIYKIMDKKLVLDICLHQLKMVINNELAHHVIVYRYISDGISLGSGFIDALRSLDVGSLIQQFLIIIQYRIIKTLHRINKR